MTKDEKNLREVFSERSMVIDPKFKQKLRKNVMKNQGGRRAGLRWPKLIFVPALALLVMVFLLAGIQKPEQGSNPLQPQSVSAAELLNLSRQAASTFDASKYNYFEERSRLNYGPMMGRLCFKDSSQEEMMQYQDSEIFNYQYESGKVEALFSGDTMPGKKNYVAYYDDTETDLISDFMKKRSYSLQQRMQEELGDYSVNAATAVIIIDEDGKHLSKEQITPKKQGGRMVYTLYLRTNPESIAPGVPEPVCGGDMVRKVVLDAGTFIPTEYHEYDGRIAEENRMFTHTMKFYYANLSAEDALERMEKAGFNKDTALREIKSGKDGPEATL
jgi:hypothetical protein